MGYVPPHLRGGGGDDDGGGNDRRDDRASAGRGGGGWDRDGGRGGGRNDGYAPRGSSGRGGGGSCEPVFEPWRPSARVEALTEEQKVEIRDRLGVIVEVIEGEEEAPSAIESFEDMSLCLDVMADIKFREYDKPSPIQAQAIPVILSGRDVLGCAETGSGKTAAFSFFYIQICF